MPIQLSVQSGSLPDQALLAAYRDSGAFTDCYFVEVEGAVEFSQFVGAFYTTRLFKLERLILKWAVDKPSTDPQAHQVARGEIEAFAAWTVERRTESQLLMCDLMGNTRSWFMTHPTEGGTRLYFGSAVVPRHDARTGERKMGAVFRALLGFHKLYSRALLNSAKRNLTSVAH